MLPENDYFEIPSNQLISDDFVKKLIYMSQNFPALILYIVTLNTYRKTVVVF